MGEFANMILQNAVLDRPVLDQTGITGRWDFTLKLDPGRLAVRRLWDKDSAADRRRQCTAKPIHRDPGAARAEAGSNQGTHRCAGDRQGRKTVGELRHRALCCPTLAARTDTRQGWDSHDSAISMNQVFERLILCLEFVISPGPNIGISIPRTKTYPWGPQTRGTQRWYRFMRSET